VPSASSLLWHMDGVLCSHCACLWSWLQHLIGARCGCARGISHKAVLSKPTIVGICGVGALMVLSHAALLLWEPLTGDVTSFDVVLASWPGVAVAAAYTVAFATFLVATRSQHKGLGKVIALLDAKRVSTDADDMIAVAIAGADADGQEALDSAVAFVAQVGGATETLLPRAGGVAACM